MLRDRMLAARPSLYRKDVLATLQALYGFGTTPAAGSNAHRSQACRAWIDDLLDARPLTRTTLSP